MSSETFNTTEAIKAQKEYCKQKKVPHFAPNNGRCWSCNQDIYSSGKHVWGGKRDGRESGGISVEKAGRELITGCPHCHRSYCD